MRDVEIPNWLRGLPLAPEFRPTDTEFADPIAYISKIEKEASAFGICKVIPPFPKPSKKYVISNLNKALSKSPELGSDVSSPLEKDNENKGNDGEIQAVFTTRHQELGQSPKRNKGSIQLQPSAVQKQVWQSGEIYTLEQFESKSKAFARSQLGLVKEVSPLVIEALFWKAASEKPIYVEYANDVPGSGFGEPEGLFRYFHRRRQRRRKTFDRNGQGSSSCKKHQLNTQGNSGENKCTSTKRNLNSFVEICTTSTCSMTSSSDQTLRLCRQKSSNTSNEMEGTAGWKLANSPWNLQVIARSPGSLTRFMPDDIPGVTSPMVYIGMLFSWFAWHVEDHELHSLNFLHTGSPKTWYAVPSDYAFAFEEVIRTKAYGGNIDHLAALTLLGEKTTLLSPEIVVASGIPCCRLIQNPGEFVVTFPRAYHVGFSHGFNCGEAANFGTPKWLSVAKEAAIRRAAMNYLPMLSHQQLLYLLTMSFVSRVPRSLLPGARSSRLRDRQKEERELLVKKAFIEDILNENNLLTALLGKNPSYHVVLWNLESLPSPSKGSELCSSTSAAITPVENACSEKENCQDLLSQMSLYMETVNDLYVDDDDLSSDFQIDSGTLACVACGILGFPFMSVIQPSKRALMDHFSEYHHVVQELEVLKPGECHSPSYVNNIVGGSTSDGLNKQNKTLKEKISSSCEWNIPKIGALKFGREFKSKEDIVKSLADDDSFSSDATDKMKRDERCFLNHLNAVSSHVESGQSMICPAEDLSPPTVDLPASLKAKFDKEWDLSCGFMRPRIFCLEHAIQIEELLHSKGGANVLVICHSDFQKLKAHAAVIAEEIGSPFNYNEIPLENASQEELNLIDLATDDEEHDECGEDWTSKLSINLQHCVKVRKNCSSTQVQHALTLGGLFSDANLSSNILNFHWKSRKSRSRRNLYAVHVKPSESTQVKKDEVFGAKSDGNIVRKEEKIIQYSRRSFKSKPGCSAQVWPTFAGPMKHLSVEVSTVDHGESHGYGKNISVSNLCDNESTRNDSSGLVPLDSCGKSKLQHENQVLVTAKDECSVASQTVDLLDAAALIVDNVGSQIDNHTSKEMIVKGKACNLTWNGPEIQQKLRVTEKNNEKNENQIMEEPADLVKSVFSCANEPVVGSFDEKMEKPVAKFCTNIDNEVQQEIQSTKGSGEMELVSCNDKLINKSSPVSMEESYVVSRVAHSVEDNEICCSADNRELEQTNSTAAFCRDSEASACVTCDDTEQHEIQIANGSTVDEHVPSHVVRINLSTSVSIKECSRVPKEIHAAMEMNDDGDNCSLSDKRELTNTDSTIRQSRSSRKNGSKRRKVELQAEDQLDFSGFIRSPCEGLRPRAGKDASRSGIDGNKMIEVKPAMKKARKKSSDGSFSCKDKKDGMQRSTKRFHRCDLEDCRMSFRTRGELVLHKRNRCPHEGCGKRFSSHNYAMLHQRVHEDDRPLKCSWKGCTMSFKWAWARTEHLRVHTGERPYQCKVEGCGLTFRFISDFSRHRRKTGHYVNLLT